MLLLEQNSVGFIPVIFGRCGDYDCTVHCVFTDREEISIAIKPNTPQQAPGHGNSSAFGFTVTDFAVCAKSWAELLPVHDLAYISFPPITIMYSGLRF